MTIKTKTFRVLLYSLGMCLLLSQPSCIFESGAARETPHDVVADRKISRLAKAFSEYVDANHSLPTPIYSSDNGNKHSWRFSILKYFAAYHESVQNSFKDYDQQEAWDSPKNRKWAKSQAYLFSLFYVSGEIVREDDPNFPHTSFLMLIHDKPLDALPENAIILVESFSCNVPCFEPKDLKIEDITKSDHPFSAGLLNSDHRTVKAMTKGLKIVDIPKNISKESLLRLLKGE